MEGFDSGSEQILLIGATNRPQELDEAARRRLTKRLYIPLPSSDARAWIVCNLLEKDGLFKLSKEDIDAICKLTEGYSGSDMKNLVKDASIGPLREALRQGIEITRLKKEDMRLVTLQVMLMWPAIVVDESFLGNCKGLNRNSRGKSVPVQFFGARDFAMVNMKQVISFLRGLLSSVHLKCKKPHFIQSLEEAKMLNKLVAMFFERQEFETEYDDDVEQLLADMEFKDSDTECVN